MLDGDVTDEVEERYMREKMMMERKWMVKEKWKKGI
jgi:hypothetical protein